MILNGFDQERGKKFKCPADRLGACVAMAAQLDVNSVAIVDLTKSLENGKKVHGPGTEHQVLMNPAHHIFDVEIKDAWRPVEHVLGD